MTAPSSSYVEDVMAEYLERVRAELIRQMVHGREDEYGRLAYAEAFAKLAVVKLKAARDRPRVV